MRPGYINTLQVLDVRRFIQVQYFIQILAVFLLKDPGVVAFLVGLRVIAVHGHFVDKKQGQHFDTLLMQSLFFIEVCLDGFPYLNAA
ncbi:hypothetical protein D3C75_1004350 [compost metagenome]